MPTRPKKPLMRKRPGRLSKASLIVPSSGALSVFSEALPAGPSRSTWSSAAPSIPLPHPTTLLPAAGPSSPRKSLRKNPIMSAYAVDRATGVQADIPALTVVSSPVPPRGRRTCNTAESTEAGTVQDKGKGKEKAVAAPAPIPTDTNMELASDGKHYLCYRGDKHRACTVCIKAGYQCIDTLNLQYHRLVCQSCKKRKTQCTAV
jgi:hypothetical protein